MPEHLAPRQIEVVLLIAKGKSNKEIGAAMGITTGTVKVYVSQAIDVLKLRSRTQIALWAHGKLEADL